MEEFVDANGVSERFEAYNFVVLWDNFITCVIAAGLILLSGQSLAPQAPIWNFAAVSGTAFWLVQPILSWFTKTKHCGMLRMLRTR